MNKVKLVFIGFQEGMNGERFKLWNIINSPCPDLHPNNSTISLVSLKEMGIVKGEFNEFNY